MPAPWAAHAQVRIIGKLHGQTTINVLNFATNTVVNDDLTGVALLKALANSVQECVTNSLVGGVTSDWKFSRCDARKTGPVTGDIVDADIANGIEGASTPTSVSFAASLINIKTGGGGRSGIGKMYLPPPGETQIADSTMAPAVEAALVQFLLCLVGKFIENATTPWRLGVLSRKKVNNVLPPMDDRFRPATQLLVNPVLAKMGSRKVGSGT